MSVEDKKGTTQERIPKWESELWDYLSSGDGVRCPTYSRCQNRLSGGWCPSDNLDYIAQLLDDRQFDVSKYDSMGSMGECGRIFQLVARLAQKYLQRAEVHCPPLPAEIISLADEQHPIEVRLVPLKIYHGAIWYLKGSWIIQLKEDDASAIKRLTLFHEAFHILAHCKTSPVFRKRGTKEGSFNELLADYFAASILMPREWVKEKWTGVKDLDKMAKIFDVSKSAMCIRLKFLGLI